jgi:hypothetical protein
MDTVNIGETIEEKIRRLEEENAFLRGQIKVYEQMQHPIYFAPSNGGMESKPYYFNNPVTCQTTPAKLK